MHKGYKEKEKERVCLSISVSDRLILKERKSSFFIKWIYIFFIWASTSKCDIKLLNVIKKISVY